MAAREDDVEALQKRVWGLADEGKSAELKAVLDVAEYSNLNCDWRAFDVACVHGHTECVHGCSLFTRQM
jgi:hypothetical protein